MLRAVVEVNGEFVLSLQDEQKDARQSWLDSDAKDGTHMVLFDDGALTVCRDGMGYVIFFDDEIHTLKEVS